MKTRIQRSSIFIPGLLLAGILITILWVFCLISLDHVVHTDLYRYGLQFSYEWAGQYWTYFRLMLGSVEVVLATTGIALLISLIRLRTGRIEQGKFVSCLLLIIAIVGTIFSAFFFTNIDRVVHTDLYRYGLQFSYEWAGQYLSYARLMLGLQSAAISTYIVSMGLFLSGKRISENQRFLSVQPTVKVSPKKLVRSILARASGPFELFLKARGAAWYLATIIIAFATALVVLTIQESGHPLAYARYALGAIFVLWLPGNSFVRAMFPLELPFKTVSKSLDFTERVALSIGMSLALVPTVGLLLNYSPWGITLTSTLLCLLLLTTIFATAAFIRENQTGTRKP